jgi:anti-anti-sigma factor
MDKSPLEITIDWTDDGSVVRLTGDLDNSSQPDLDAAYEAASQVDGKIVLDFERAGFIDSTGIGAILRFLRRARSQNRTVIAAGLSDHYREVFEITHLSDFVTIEAADDIGEAPSNDRDARKNEGT